MIMMTNPPDCMVKMMKELVKIHVASSQDMSLPSWGGTVPLEEPGGETFNGIKGSPAAIIPDVEFMLIPKYVCYLECFSTFIFKVVEQRNFFLCVSCKIVSCQCT